MNSVYIHIPFCNSICSYCDFCKLYSNEEFISLYLGALKKEIKRKYKGEIIKTIYVGGGTPSCLSSKHLKVLFSIISLFNLDKKYEFTFECNVCDINEDLLLCLKNNGVNRLSIGVQSFNKKILKILGRKSISDCYDRIILCKNYFSNINIDLIYGVNGQTLKDLDNDLNKYLELDLSHISIYSLILEDNTILKINNYKEIDEDLNRDMYELIISKLSKHGYIHYEISNFCKKGCFSSHNLEYWNNNHYYGFGLGASGYINNIRYTNTRSINNYINEKFVLEKEIITKELDMEYFMILGLRKIKGVSNKDFKKRYGFNICDIYNCSMLKKRGYYYFIDKNNLYISNSILINFVNI